MGLTATSLRVPAATDLPEYSAALERGWSPDNTRAAAAAEQLAAIAADPAAFLALLDDPGAAGPPIRLPDGSTVPRLPSLTRWIWSDGFCGSIGFRWQPGTAALPDHVLGHVGFAVVPWRRGQGHATRALALFLDEPRRHGLAHVDLTTNVDNLACQQVVVANSGRLVDRFEKLPAYGGGEALRFRIVF
ncbi:GNAT family N-acetyltransferase [Polymorphobacter fuscus]|uniref:GNAT family N-acetyltransferase n=1 Tax=Sandarakinorhabdus fusca TaxID=1439888 RepID=A0A7C9GYC3_9SPHN|nr:GNAT family N-acetyltransferase [Polymorphobacter fuscus]KAB7645434.1 GNAT family N-acetyltransferase [Polymorphobacter fuscus]MQT17854.1 GNAT family N-acetyltransferase [Polymorphobacter fuscus]NJC08483.1 putative acetyltransferase [Polymorphobacter fuscus]